MNEMFGFMIRFLRMQNLLVGKNVFLTGVGGNIGRHVALEMAAQGAAIYFLDSDESCCARLHKDLQLRGVTARGWTLDIAQPATLQKLHANWSNNGLQSTFWSTTSA